MTSVVSLARSACGLLETIVRHRKILTAVTRVEIAKRYSGSALGKIWIVLYPALLLANYLFLYLVIFQIRFPDWSQLDYVLYVFCGLIPFLGISEALSSGCAVLKQNLYLVRNVLLPIELIPVRSLLVSMVTQLASLGLLLVFLGLHGSLSLHVLWLPVVLLLQMLFLIGLVLLLSLFTVLLPDVSYFVNLALVFLMFVSPIGFRADMVPGHFKLLLYLNPIHYLVELYRCSLLWGKFPSRMDASICIGFCLALFVLGCAVFRKFKGVLADAE